MCRISRIITRCFAIILLVAITGTLFAQELPDTKGKEFYLVSMANLGTDEHLTYFTIFITSEFNATGTVSIVDGTFSQSFSVTANGVTSVTLPSGDMPNSAELVSNEVVQHRAIHVTATNDITVYAISHKYYSCDAYLSYPVDALGKQYYVMAFASSPSGGTQNTGSQFAAIATENNTTVMVTPSMKTASGKTGQFSITLPLAGDVVQVKGDSTDATNDLTGTFITSDKPIAAFSGHRRALVETTGNHPSRDHLIEQLPPVPTWGTVVPIAIPKLSTDQNMNPLPYTVRILASRNNTAIKINGLQVAVRDKGKFYEFQTSTSVFAEASYPILTGIYSPSTGSGSGDPFLALLTPAEQYLNDYTFVLVIDGVSYGENFVTITAPNDTNLSIVIDGTPILYSMFQPVGTSQFVSLNLSLQQGNHRITGNRDFGITVYAYGQADSYGYIGGSGLKETPVCDFLSVSTTAKAQNCCHELSLGNLLQSGLIYSLQAKVLTPGVSITSASGPWSPPPSHSASGVIWDVPPPGLAIGTTDSLVVCFTPPHSGLIAIAVDWDDAAGRVICTDTVFMNCSQTGEACIVPGTPTFTCTMKDTAGNQMYSYSLPVTNNTGLSAKLITSSPQGITGTSPITIPTGSSTVTGLFNDTPPVDTSICLAFGMYRGSTFLCQDTLCGISLPQCTTTSPDTCLETTLLTIICKGKDEGGHQKYSYSLTVTNNSGTSGDLVTSSQQGAVSPSPVSIPTGTATVNGTFADLPPKDSTICFDFSFQNVCSSHICNIALPKCVSGVSDYSSSDGGIYLGTSFPDPSHGVTRIGFTLAQTEQHVLLVVTDCRGAEVRRLVNNETVREGEHTVTLDVRALPSGTYFYTLRAGSTSLTRTLRVIR